MRTMKASEFKAKCLQVLDEVQATGVPVRVTKRGKTVAKLVPGDAAPQETALEKFERLFPKELFAGQSILPENWKEEVRKDYGNLEDRWPWSNDKGVDRQ
jgi:prevent-host-death family protein